MNVGLVVPGFSADPSDWCIPALRDFARVLSRTNHVRVIALRYPHSAGRYDVDGAHVIGLGGAVRRGAGVLPLWRETLTTLRAEHRRQSFDVLHAFWATESGLLAAIAGRLLHIPTLVSLAGGELVGLRDIGYGDQLYLAQRLKIRLALRMASAVSAGSRYLVELAGHPVLQLPLGVDTSRFAPQPASSEPPGPRLLHVGSLVPVKDQRMLLDAFATVTAEARLDIVGDGPLRPALEQHARELGLADRICVRGAVDHGHLPQAYRSAAALVLSSRHEAQSMAALEAAACSTAVVGTAVGVIPELAAEASVPVRDAAALGLAMQRTLRDRPHQSLPERFTLDSCTAAFEACYARLVQRR